MSSGIAMDDRSRPTSEPAESLFGIRRACPVNDCRDPEVRRFDLSLGPIPGTGMITFWPCRYHWAELKHNPGHVALDVHCMGDVVASVLAPPEPEKPSWANARRAVDVRFPVHGIEATLGHVDLERIVVYVARNVRAFLAGDYDVDGLRRWCDAWMPSYQRRLRHGSGLQILAAVREALWRLDDPEELRAALQELTGEVPDDERDEAGSADPEPLSLTDLLLDAVFEGEGDEDEEEANG